MADRSKECSLCLEAYCDPRILPDCTHSFCKQCLNRYIDSNRFKDKFKCPQCRVDTAITANRADDFKKNTALAAAAEFSVCGYQDCDKPAAGLCRQCGVCYCQQCHDGRHLLPPPHGLTPLSVARNPNLRRLFCEKLGHERQERVWVNEDQEDTLLCVMCEQKQPVKNKTEVPEKAERLREQLKCEVASCNKTTECSRKLLEKMKKNGEIVNDRLKRLKNLVDERYKEYMIQMAAVEKKKHELFSALDSAKKGNDKNLTMAINEISKKITTAEEAAAIVSQDVQQMENIDVVLTSKTKMSLLKEHQIQLNKEIDIQRKVKLDCIDLTNEPNLTDTTISRSSNFVTSDISPHLYCVNLSHQIHQVITMGCSFLRLFFDSNTNSLLGQCGEAGGHSFIHIYNANLTHVSNITDLKTKRVSTNYGMLVTANNGLFILNGTSIVQMERQYNALIEKRRLHYKARAICDHGEKSFLFYMETNSNSYISLYNLEKNFVEKNITVPKSDPWHFPTIAYCKAMDSVIYALGGENVGNRLLIKSISDNRPVIELLKGKRLYVHTDHVDNVFILETSPENRLFWLNPSNNQPEEVITANILPPSYMFGSMTTDKLGNMYVYSGRNWEQGKITKCRYLPV